MSGPIEFMVYWQRPLVSGSVQGLWSAELLDKKYQLLRAL
jgi:hypothetical protein